MAAEHDEPKLPAASDEHSNHEFEIEDIDLEEATGGGQGLHAGCNASCSPGNAHS